MTLTHGGRALIPLTPVQRAARRSVLDKLRKGTYQLEEVSACLCGSTRAHAIARQDRYGIPVGVMLCDRCGLARTSPRLAAENLGSFYEQEYHALHQGIRNPDRDAVLFRRGQGIAIADFLADHLPNGPLRVADVGAGSGQVLREFGAAVSEEVVGVGCEYASEFVNAGRRAGSDLRRGGPEVLASAGPFDVVILSHVVEHFPNPVRDLASVRNLGDETDATLFYIEVPGLLTIHDRPEYAYALGQYVTLAHTYHFTLETLRATMRRAGFRLLRGTEDVRAVFVTAAPDEPSADESVAPAILASLRRLDAPSARVRRVPQLAKQRAAAIAKTILPKDIQRRVKHRR